MFDLAREAFRDESDRYDQLRNRALTYLEMDLFVVLIISGVAWVSFERLGSVISLISLFLGAAFSAISLVIALFVLFPRKTYWVIDLKAFYQEHRKTPLSEAIEAGITAFLENIKDNRTFRRSQGNLLRLSILFLRGGAVGLFIFIISSVVI